MKFCIHATNINGLGAVVLCRDIISLMISDENLFRVYVSQSLFDSLPIELKKNKKISIFRRHFPNYISRFFELFFSRFFFQPLNTIVLGDIPINLKVKQNVLVHNPIYSESFSDYPINLSNLIKKLLFLFFVSKMSTHIKNIYVQTRVMRSGLTLNLSFLRKKSQLSLLDNPLSLNFIAKRPAILNARLSFKHRRPKKALTLLYPSAFYLHKNHDFLKFLDSDKSLDLYIDKIILTIDPDLNPAPRSRLIQCTGVLSYNKILELYRSIDCIVYLSQKESLGLPLIEAQSLGIPIICPDLPYSTEVCKIGTFFYQNENIDDFKRVILEVFSNNLSQFSPAYLADNSWQVFCSKLKDFN